MQRYGMIFAFYICSKIIDSRAGFPPLGRFLLYDLVDGMMAIAIPLGNHQWGMLIDGTKAPLGLLLNVVFPKAIDAFEEAIAT